MTNGHIHVLEQSLALCDQLVVGIGVQAAKTPMFSFDERAAMIADVVKAEFPERSGDVSVISFQGLVVEAAKQAGATVLVRGLRDGTRSRLRDADGRDEPGDGARHHHRVCAGLS